MARIRSIHPNICSSEAMAELPAEVERTYCRLWTHCDDHGRCIDNVKLIKAAIYPLHDDMTNDVLNEHLNRLVVGRHLIGYQVDGKAFLQVREWKKYQHPQRARDSVIPGPEASRIRTRGRADMSGPVVGEVEGEVDGVEGRGDCPDTSGSVPTNPSRLSQIRSGLKAVGDVS